MAEKTIQNEKALAPTAEAQVPATREAERYLIPAVDIFESEDGLTLLADMPGVDKDGVDIRVEEGVLTIKGTCAHDLRDANNYREFGLLDYWRQFSLNEEVDSDKISAELKHGVLSLRLPKGEKALPKRIDVKVG